jgi:ketosteroid isomerase-like protein
MHANEQLLHDFYAAFERLDAAAMGAVYAPDAHFSDPVFPDLRGAQVPAMWAMLTGRSTGIHLEVSDVVADDASGRSTWVAHYKFGPQQRPVVNVVHSAFTFSGGRVKDEKDTFDFHAWAAMALGTKGRLLGWTPLVRRAAQAQAARGLAEFMAKSPSS